MRTNDSFVSSPAEILIRALTHPTSGRDLKSAEYRTSLGMVTVQRNPNGTVSVIARRAAEHYEYEGNRCTTSAPLLKLSEPRYSDASPFLPFLTQTNFIAGNLR